VDWIISILRFVEDAEKGGIVGVMIVIPCLIELRLRYVFIVVALCITQIFADDAKPKLPHILRFVPGQFIADQSEERFIT